MPGGSATESMEDDLLRQPRALGASNHGKMMELWTCKEEDTGRKQNGSGTKAGPGHEIKRTDNRTSHVVSPLATIEPKPLNGGLTNN